MQQAWVGMLENGLDIRGVTFRRALCLISRRILPACARRGQKVDGSWFKYGVVQSRCYVVGDLFWVCLLAGGILVG